MYFKYIPSKEFFFIKMKIPNDLTIDIFSIYLFVKVIQVKHLSGKNNLNDRKKYFGEGHFKNGIICILKKEIVGYLNHINPK